VKPNRWEERNDPVRAVVFSLMSGFVRCLSSAL